MSQNPNWPVMDEAVCWTAGPQQTSVQPYWCSLIERTEAQLAIEGGKQYELDQTQPGQMTSTWRNDDGAFDPDNETSPFAGYVTAYRLIRRRAQYPPSVNLLTQNQATAGQATAIPNAPQIEQPWAVGSTPDATSVVQHPRAPTTIATSASAWVGSTVYNHAVQSSATYPFNPVGMASWSVAPTGLAYAFTAHARAVTGITATAALSVQWVNASGAVMATSTATAVTLATGTSWSTLTLLATAPVGACGAVAFVKLASGPASTSWTLQTTGYDIRKDTVAGYVTPGTWYPMFLGYIERWPQSWTSGGNYGSVSLTAMDIFANFAGRKMLAPIKADLMALNPNFLYALDEAAGTNAFADLTGNRGHAIVSPSALSNSATSGQSVASADNAPRGPDLNVALTGAFLGSPGPVVHSQVPPATASSLASILIPPDPATGLVGPPQTGGFTRLIAARVTGLATFGTQSAWYYWAGAPSDEMDISITISSGTAYITASSEGPGASSGVSYPLGNFFSGTAVADSDWHIYGVSLSADGKTLSGWMDMSPTPVTSTTGASCRPDSVSPGAAVDSIAGLNSPSNVLNNSQWIGDVAFACELPFTMDGTTWSQLAQSWRNAWATAGTFTETSDSRYARVLGWLGYVGPTRLSAGSSVKYGPATEVADQYGLPVLQTVVDSEAGSHFVAADGAVTFQSRADRYNKSAVVTFGENVAGGEYPYLSAQTDFDPTRVGNDAQVTATYGNALYRAQDPVSQNTFGDITLTRTVNSLDPNELTAAAQFLLLTNNVPLTRLQELPFDLSQNPALWPVLLALQLGVCVGWNRRPSNAPTLSLTGFVEKISWAIDDQNNATCKLQVSNAAKRNFWQWNVSRWSPDAGSMTVHTAMAASMGATTVVIDTAGGSPTASVNAGSYPVTVVIDNEQIVLNNAPSGATSPQTFTGCTRAANGTTLATHSIGAVLSLATPGRWAY